MITDKSVQKLDQFLREPTPTEVVIADDREEG